MPRKRPKFRIRRRAAPRKRTRLAVVLSDDNRRPFPGIEVAPHRAQYFITALGRVYRDDGFLVAVCPKLLVRLNAGHFTRSVPQAVAQAFGHPSPTYGDLWRAWVDPDGPVDELTGRTRCSVADVKYVTHSDLVRYGITKQKPTKTRPLL